jgi:hypothetical protein
MYEYIYMAIHELVLTFKKIKQIDNIISNTGFYHIPTFVNFSLKMKNIFSMH